MPDLPRRDFIKQIAATGAAAGAAFSAAAGAQQTSPQTSPQTAPATQPESPFVGIQMGPHTMLDEGIEHALDLIQETAAVNVVMPYSHAYNGALNKTPAEMAQDHNTPARDNRNRKFPLVWVKTHDAFYKNTTLRHQQVDNSFEYADRDLFAEMLAPARKRNMKVYARILEGTGLGRSIANFNKVVTRDINDRPTAVPCWNHPEYIGFWSDTMEDLFRSYELDGLQWGAERQGPLMNVISPWNNDPPSCFCEHCRARAKKQNIDADRAHKGFEELFKYCQARMAANAPKPADGIFAGFLRVLIRYPEILSWEYQYRLSREEIYEAMYKRVKAIKPTAQVGWHVDHQPTSWDIVYRAEMSYEEMAPHSDYIKIIAYHSVLGPRIRSWYLPRFQKTILGEVPLAESLDLYYDVFGYDKTVEPALADLTRKGFTADYVGRETKHAVASANGKTKIYTGVGFDVPGSPPDTVDMVYDATVKSLAAGAAGIVISREYEEMRVPNLKAVGKAIRDGAKKN